MTTRTLAVVTAGLSQPSATRLLADRLAEATDRALRLREVTPVVEVVELRDLAHDLTDNLLTGFPGPRLKAALGTVTGADGLVAVTPVFSGSYSGLFKTFVDVLGKDSVVGLPVLVAATAGTARHSLALDHAMRPLFTYLRAVVVPTGVFAAAEDWGTGDAATGRALQARIERAAGELAALVAARETAAPADPFGDPTPFERLLAGGSRGRAGRGQEPMPSRRTSEPRTTTRNPSGVGLTRCSVTPSGRSRSR
jgi:FMN reductase